MFYQVVAVDRENGNNLLAFQHLSTRERGTKDGNIVQNIKVEIWSTFELQFLSSFIWFCMFLRLTSSLQNGLWMCFKTFSIKSLSVSNFISFLKLSFILYLGLGGGVRVFIRHYAGQQWIVRRLNSLITSFLRLRFEFMCKVCHKFSFFSLWA